MKIIILNLCTDKKNTILGFATQWIELLSNYFEEIHVVTMQSGFYKFKKNVFVYEIKKSKLRLLTFYLAIIKIIFKKNIDACFAHMTPFQLNLSFPFFFIKNVKTLLWYEHGKVTNTLRIANYLCDRTISASKSKYNLNNKKNFVLGHGIDTDLFYPKRQKKDRAGFNIIYVGRISRIKGIDKLLILMIKLKSLKKQNYHLDIIGDTAGKDSEKYYQTLKKFIKENNLSKEVTFKNGIERENLPFIYSNADILISASKTNSLDKVVLEAMACETIVLTSNYAFSEILCKSEVNECFCKSNDINALFKSLLALLEKDKSEKLKIQKALRKIVLKDHSIKKTIEKISFHLKDIV